MKLLLLPLLLLLLFNIFSPVLARVPSSVPAASPVSLSSGEDYHTLKTAERFSIGGVGYAGIPSQPELAFRRLLKQPHALARFRQLLTDATPAGQFYALLGLRLLDQPTFQAALPRYGNSKAEVSTISGCVVGKTPASKLARQIEAGELK